MADKIGKWGVADYLVTGAIVIIAGIGIAFSVKQINKLQKEKESIQAKV